MKGTNQLDLSLGGPVKSEGGGCGGWEGAEEGRGAGVPSALNTDIHFQFSR